MSRAVRDAQRLMNAYVVKHKLGHSKLKEDGEDGPSTDARVRLLKGYAGYVDSNADATISDEFLWRLRHPRRSKRKPGREGFTVERSAVRRGIRARQQRRAAIRRKKRRAAQSASDRLWGGSRAVTNDVIDIVGDRAPITSRKRTATFGNPGSDHHVSQVTADAVDFGIANAYSLAHEIARKLGGSWDGDYDSFTVTRGSRRYRVQIIAGTHGTGPHLHVGVRRA